MSSAEEQRRWRASKGVRVGGRRGPEPSAECGTVPGYKGHVRRGEPKCDLCWAAWATYQRERYAARRSG